MVSEQGVVSVKLRKEKSRVMLERRRLTYR